MKIGAHVSAAGGIFNAPANAAKIGAEVWQVFSRPPQGGPAPKLTPDIVRQFGSEAKKYGFTDCLIPVDRYSEDLSVGQVPDFSRLFQKGLPADL